MRRSIIHRSFCLIIAVSAGTATASNALAHGYLHAQSQHHHSHHEHDRGERAFSASVLAAEADLLESRSGQDHAHPPSDRAPVVRNQVFAVPALVVSVALVTPPTEATLAPHAFEPPVATGRSTGPPPKLRAPPRTA